ncbi:MAG: hypothetical protein RLP44_09020 [Aggregatilineales bacterium]
MNGVTNRTVVYIIGAIGLLIACVLLARLASEVIDLLPLADRQFVVMQSSALNLPETTAALFAHVQFALFATSGMLLGMAIFQQTQVFGGGWLSYLAQNPVLVLAPFLLVVLLWFAFERSIVINGTRFFYLDDDAMITMRYARNLANGHGAVWNIGEPVEGYTNFLWMLVMAGVHLPGFPETITSLVVMLINWGLVVGALIALQATLKALNVGRMWMWLVCLGFACDLNILHWANSGLEASLLANLVMVCAWALIRQRTTIFLITLALIPLARADAWILALALGLVFLYQERNLRAVGLLLMATLPTIAHLIFRVTYYGELLPNTYYLKMTGIHDRWLIGVSYIMRLFNLYPLGLLAIGIGVWLEPKIRFVALIWLAQIAYVIYAGGDTFWLLRPVVAVLPLMYLSAGVVLDRLTGNMAQSTAVRWALAGVFVLSVPAIANGGVLFTNPQQEAALFGGQVQVMAHMIEANVPTDMLISIEPAGSIPYFAQDYAFVDALGKSDAHIAQLPAHSGNTLIGHNKFDWQYVYQVRQPDIVLASCVLPDIWINLPESARANVFNEAGTNGLAYLPYQILYPDFETLYHPNRVIYGVPSPSLPEEDWIICPFVREGSAVPLAWDLPTND